MSPIFVVLIEIFGEIIQKNELRNLKTTSDLAQILEVSAPHLSRIKNGKSPLGDEVMIKAFEKIDKLEKNIEQREVWKVKLKTAQAKLSGQSQSGLLETNTASSTDALEDFHNRFFKTPLGDNPSERIICMLYNEMPQSREEGNNPEYIETGLSETTQGIACAMFQPFGPLKNITEKMIDVANKKGDVTPWSYILALASEVHKIYEKTKKMLLTNKNNRGQVILYEACKVPSLSECNLHSRLYYSEKLLGKDKARVVQLVMGKQPTEEYYIECNMESAFKSVVAAQFYPILNYWRTHNGRLPTVQSEIETFYKKISGENKKSPWRISE